MSCCGLLFEGWTSKLGMDVMTCQDSAGELGWRLNTYIVQALCAGQRPCPIPERRRSLHLMGHRFLAKAGGLIAVLLRCARPNMAVCRCTADWTSLRLQGPGSAPVCRDTFGKCTALPRT